MMKEFYQHVNKSYERILLKFENPLLLFGDLLTLISTLLNTLRISFKKFDNIARTIEYHSIDKYEEIGEYYGAKVLVIDGAPHAVSKEFAQQLEVYYSEKAENKKRIKADV